MNGVRYRRGVLTIHAAIAIVGCQCGTVMAAGQAGAGTGGYTLVNRTPPAQMRDMSTDRPDVTESPRTVDAGHVQIEISLVDYARAGAPGARTRTLSMLPANLKVGLLDDVDLQFIFTPRVARRVTSGGHEARTAGFGEDTELRLKVNLWGNDGPTRTFGGSALGVMPFVRFPTGPDGGADRRLEAGVILPFATQLAGGFDLGVMAELDVEYDDASEGYGLNLVHSASLGHRIPGTANLTGYLEYVGTAPARGAGTYQAVSSVGLTYAVRRNWTLDCGGTARISGETDDITGFVGTSFRF
jgi:hypothetical protein